MRYNNYYEDIGFDDAFLLGLFCCSFTVGSVIEVTLDRDSRILNNSVCVGSCCVMW